MITQAQLQTIKDNYVEARKSLHPAHNWDLGMARNAINEVLALVGGAPAKLVAYGNGEILVDICTALNANKDLCIELLPLFEGINYRTGEIRYGYNKTFYGQLSGWFYVTGWQALHNQILSWGE